MFRRFLKAAGRAALLGGLLAAAGCAWRQPRLHALRVDQVALPNRIIEPAVWGRAKEIEVTARTPAGVRLPVRLRAIHDGRALGLLISWPDRSEGDTPPVWVWDEQRHEYRWVSRPNDEVALLWPMSPDPTFAAVPEQPEGYDLWRWRGGWTNLSGHADDARLLLRQHPRGTDPATVEGELFPVPGTDRWIERQVIPDTGQPGTRPTTRPLLREEERMPGTAADFASGSQADVEALALYAKVRDFQPSAYFRYGRRRTPGYWFSDEIDHAEDGFWFVEFHRLLVTPHDEEDAQLRGDGPHRFAVWVVDEGQGPDPFRTGPIELRLQPSKQTRDDRD
ncbi:MAG TPA: hypothetical protein PLS90_13770 [Candidatus Sumerlaeota bacterium]|nr:MAG: Ethylbenzene dehydrogenase [candidate division BRC1 bacterium ADurb.BinA292]HPK03511.1 hypothetical protein [Candidatus Sumerlaeota bacterium]